MGLWAVGCGLWQDRSAVILVKLAPETLQTVYSPLLTDNSPRPSALEDQLDRASSSIVLNLAEGHGRTTAKDRARFYQIAYGSLRECQAILDLSRGDTENAQNKADRLGASIYCLIKNVRPSP